VSEKDLETFTDYFSDVCELDADARLKFVALLSEFLPDLRRESLEDAKGAVRQMLKGRTPYGVGPKLSRVLGLCEERRKEANAGKAKVCEYSYEEGDAFRHERAAIRDARPQWDALDDEDRQFRLRMAAKQMGEYEFRKGKWQDAAGRRVPASIVERHAILALAKTTQEVS
jgi:hypothetical protein